MRLTPLFLLLLSACGSDEIKLGDDTAGTSDTDTDTDADSDTDTDSDTDADTNAFAGDYTGTMSLDVVSPDGQEMTICTGDASLAVDDAGALTGDGECVSENSPGSITATFTGTVDDRGAVTGSVEQTLPMGDPDTFDLTGLFTTSGATLDWTGDIQDPRGNTVTFTGALVTD
jgi:hypothetical protein